MRYLLIPLALIFIFMQLACKVQQPTIQMQTELGDITIKVYPKKAPITVKNFLKYVDENRYEGATFYRVVTPTNQPENKIRIEVIQGGLGFDSDKHSNVLAPIEHETTDQTEILHKDGVISMARLEPGTASSEIFICVGDQEELDFGGQRNPDGQGFAAFGKVIDGMEVVRQIQQQPEEGQMLVKEVKILGVKRK